MTDPLKSAVLAAMRRIARPLARLMVEAGIGAGEFHSIMKNAFVQAAQDAGDAARPNASRIATLTGLTRREVTTLLRTPEDEAPEVERHHPRIQRVLTGWWTDPEFQDAEGSPAPLPLRGRRVSFVSLVKRYSGEPRVRTILDELLRVKAVRRMPDGKFEALTRRFASARWDPDGVTVVGEQVRDHLETLAHNLKHPSRPRFARSIENTQLDPKWVPLVIRDMTAQADTLLDSLDDALNNPGATVTPGPSSRDAVRLGITVYVHETPVVIEPPSAIRAARPPAKRGRKGR